MRHLMLGAAMGVSIRMMRTHVLMLLLTVWMMRCVCMPACVPEGAAPEGPGGQGAPWTGRREPMLLHNITVTITITAGGSLSIRKAR